MHKRHCKRWSVNELLSLEREYDLLELSVDQISQKHGRTVNSILFKLQDEGLINNWNEARGFGTSSQPTWKTTESTYSDDDESDEDIDDTNDEDYVYEEPDDDEVDDADDADEDDVDDTTSAVSKLSDRVWTLESSVSEISSMVKQMFNSMVSAKNQPFYKEH